MHTSLNDVQSEMDFISDIEDKAPLAIETLARIAFITENFKKSLENCNKDLVAITWLDEAERALKNIKSYLSNYKNNKDANMLFTISNIIKLLGIKLKNMCKAFSEILYNFIERN